MAFCRAEAAKHFPMSQCSITLVKMELILGVFSVQANHIPISGDFGYDRGKLDDYKFFIAPCNSFRKTGLSSSLAQIQAAI